MRLILLVIGAIIISTTWADAQKIRGLDASPLDLAVFRPEGHGTHPVARIIYSRPLKKKRNVFGELVPYGKIWRTGANQSTEINVYRDIVLEGHRLSKGDYTLYTIPDEKEWTIIFNSSLYTWGTYDYFEANDVLRFKVPVQKSKEIREAFGIAFDGADGKGKILMAWDDLEVLINFEY